MSWSARHRLSTHFRLGEFADWHTHRLPPAESHEGLQRLAAGPLEHLRQRHGVVHIASGYRTPETNREVGGAPESRHLYDRFPSTPAADIVVEGRSPKQVFAELDDLGVGGLGLYRSHVHVDLRKGRARWSDLNAE